MKIRISVFGVSFAFLFLALATAFGDNGMPPFHMKDSSGNSIEYYPVGYLFLQEKEMVGKYAAGCFTIIKKVNKTGWLVEASEGDMPGTKTFFLKIPKTWDVQTVVRNPDGFGASSKLVGKSGPVPFRALTTISLIVLTTSKSMTFTNSLDDTQDSVRVLELKVIAAQPCR